jgi:hypothetical protein
MTPPLDRAPRRTGANTGPLRNAAPQGIIRFAPQAKPRVAGHTLS